MKIDKSLKLRFIEKVLISLVTLKGGHIDLVSNP